jgi:hypothetical protein
LALAELDETAGPAALLALPLLMTEVAAAAEDWLVAGVVEVPAGADGTVANVLGEQIGDLRSGIQEQLALMARGPDGPESAAELGITLTAVVDALVEGPMLRLTPLGGYGLARLLAAHGWDVPEAGACADLASGDLLDRLTAYTPRDALDEMTGWLDARGDRWAEALREVIWSAAVTGEDGPVRRALLPGLLYAAGPRVASVLDGVQGDPWLSAVVAVARDLLGVGPQVTLAQRLWLAVDGLYLDVDDDLDDFEEALQDSDLPELLAEPGAVAAAVGLDHPHTREVLRAAAPHLEDPQLKRSLRKALTGKSGNPALRVVAGRGGRGREAGSGGRGRRN